jgi:hypothetical protein
VDLEALSGVPKSAIQRYASGSTSTIPAERAEMLGRALGTTGAWILGLTDDTLRVFGHHVARLHDGSARIIDELEPEVYVDIPADEFEHICAADNFNEVLARLQTRADELKAKKLSPELREELNEVNALFSSLTDEQKEQAKNFLRFLKGSEGSR